MRTRVRGATLTKRGLITLLGVTTLVLVNAGPAAAQTATVGSGAGTGWEYVPAEHPCGGLPTSGASYTSDDFVLNHVSTYQAVDSSGATVATFVGPAQMKISTAAVTQAPQGAAAGNCPNGSGPLVPSLVNITSVTIDGPVTILPAVPPVPTVGTVHCIGGTGTYARVGTAVTFTFVVNCNFVSVTGSVTNARVRHVVEGNQIPCFPLACPQDPVNPDPFFGTNNAASSHMETTFQAEGPA